MKSTIKLFLAASIALIGLFACSKPETELKTETDDAVTLSVAPSSLSLEVGSTGKVSATVKPVGTTVTWTSSDKNVATVADGVVTAVGAGKATITATAKDKTATCEVTVTEAPVQYSITLSDEMLSLEVGQTETVTATVSPEGTPVQWGSTNEEVATVDDGVVSALAPGTATITASVGTVTAQCILTVTEPVVIDDGEGIAIDLCESLTNNGNWETTGDIQLDMENKTQGGASVSTTMTEGEQVQIIFQKPFTTPIDASSIDPEKATLSLDVWIEDVSKLNLNGNVEASQLEISSNAEPDHDEVSWAASTWKLQNGWNHLELRFQGAKRDGTIDLSQIRRFRWYNAAKIGNVTIKIDNIRIVEREFSAEDKPSDPDAIYLHHCDNTDGWGNVSFTIDSEDHQEGKACLSTTVSGDFVWLLDFDPVDCSTLDKSNGVLAFDMYVSNAAGMKLNAGGGQIELSSTSKDDDHEYCWNLASLTLVDGWNHVELPLVNAEESGGTPDMSAIKRMRFYHVAWSADGAITIKLDNIRLIKKSAGELPLYSCDDNGGWSGFAGVDTEDKTEGTGSLWWKNGAGWIHELSIADTPMDISFIPFETCAVSFDLWVETLEDCLWDQGDGEFEFSSSGRPDENEINWKITVIGQQVTKAKDWNHIELKFSEANKKGGDIDLSRFCFMRFYHVGFAQPEKDITLKIDNVRLSY